MKCEVREVFLVADENFDDFHPPADIEIGLFSLDCRQSLIGGDIKEPF